MATTVVWEKVDTRIRKVDSNGHELTLHTGVSIQRAKVPGGWLLEMNGNITFYPDPDYRWQEESAV